MAKRWTAWLAALAFVGFLGLTAHLVAQAMGTKQAPATLDDLLAEVRGLRADLAQSSGTTIRTQLLVARLQVEEQRVNNLLRQLADAQALVSDNQQVISATEAQLHNFEAALERPSRADGPPREDLNEALAHQQHRLKELQQQGQQLLARQNELMNQYEAEQARWNDFNARLDSLERSLVPAR